MGINIRFIREKRYLLFMPEYIYGGAETQFRYLIDYAEKKQWALDVIIEHRIKEKKEALPKSLKEFKNVKIYEYDWQKADNTKILYDVTVFILKKIPHVQYRACLIYYMNDLVLAPMLRILNVPVIYSERIAAVGISQNISLLKYLWYCDRILANSVYAQKKLMEMTGRTVGLIRNGKPVAKQLPLKEKREIDRILIPANIIPRKNQMLLLHYIKSYADFKGKLIFAGSAIDMSYYKELVQYAKRYNLQDRIEFLGFVENMEEEYRKADLVILPSLNEGTPNVVLEAYSYGRPVIVSDIEVERDVIRNPCLRFGVRNVAELDACIKYVQGLSDEAYRQLLENNRRFVLRNYNIDRMAESFYKEFSKGKKYSMWHLAIMRFSHFYKKI